MRAIFKTICLICIFCVGQNVVDAQKKCRQGPLDVVFILESSLDTGRKAYEHMKTFMINVARQIGIGTDSNRLSITFFNKEVRDLMNLNETKGVPALRKMLAKQKYWSGGNRVTNIGNAMRYIAKEKFGDVDKGQRPELGAVCVIIMDGVASDLSQQPAANLRKHCRIVVLGVQRPNYFELSKIASEPTLGHLRILQTYVDLVRFTKWVSETICQPPVSQMQLKRGRITDTSIQITWSQQPFADKYSLQVRLSGKRAVIQSKSVSSNETSVTFRDLKEGTKYSFDAWALDEDGKRGPKSAIFLSTGIPVPDLILDHSSVTRTSFIVRWNSAGLRGVTFYITVRRAGTKRVVTASSASGSRHLVTGLLPGRSYSVELSVIFRGERSETDKRLIVHTTPDPPEVSMAYVTDRSVKLQWPPTSGASAYGIRTYDIETSSGIELLVRIDETNATSFIVEPLLSGKKYRFDVSSKTAAGIESSERSSVSARVAPSNPSKVDLVSRTTRSVNITWNWRDGVTTYLIKFKTVTSSNWLRWLTEKRWFNAEGLGVGTTYIFNVYSLGENSEYDTENPATLTVQTVPKKVDGLLVQEITQNSVTLSWNRARGATEYFLQFRDATTKEVLKTETVDQPKGKVTGLQTGITYLITVAAVGQDGVQGEESDAQLVITLPDVPGKPRLTKKTNTTLTFEWDPVKGAIQYMIDIEGDNSTNPKELRTRETFYIFENLKFGFWYSVRLRSVGSGGRINNQPSEPGRGQTMPRTPHKPTITELTASSLTVTWKEIRAAAGYILNIRMEGKEKLLESRNTTETNYKINNLDGGETYYASVIAYSEDWRQTAESDWTLMETMPESPGKPRVLKVSSSTVKLEWDSIKGASAYIISVSDLRTLTEVRSTGTEFTVRNLTPSTHYSFGLYSVAIEGTRNEKESLRVTAITAPSPPEDVRVTDSSMTSVELSWFPVRGAVSYIVRYKSIREDEGKDDGELPADTASVQTIPQLKAGYIYEFHVFAVGLDGSESDPGVLIDGTLPAIPDAPLILLIGSTNVTVSWSPAKGAASYLIMAKNAGFEREVASNTTRANVDLLMSGTLYDFTVMSVDIKGRVNFIESPKTKEQTLTSPPEGVTKDDVTMNEITLSWEKGKGAIYYSVELGYSTDEKAPRNFMAYSTNYTISQLDPGSTYKVRVASVGTNFLESDFSDWIVIATIPKTPSIPEVTHVTNSSIELSWEPVKGVVFYSVSLRRDDGDVINRNSTEPSIVFKDLKPGVWFDIFLFSVGAENGMNDEPSPTIRVQTALNTPTDFSVMGSTVTTISLKWHRVTGADEYKIFVIHDEMNIANQTAEDTAVTIRNLKPGSVYSFMVAAKGSSGRYSEKTQAISESTNTAVPSQPLLTDISSTSVTLQWELIEGAVKYGVYYEELESGKSSRLEIDTNTISISDLSSGTWYNFSISSIGFGGKESDKSIVLKEQTIPETPSSVQVKNVGMDFITVVWDASKGASSYRTTYEWQGMPDKVSQEVEDSEDKEVTLSQLSTGTDYVITVQAVGSTGKLSPVSSPVQENTIPATPKTPTLEVVEASMFSVSWNEVEGASSYIVEVTPEVGRKTRHETPRSEWMKQRAEPGKWYKINVQSKDDKNRGNGIPSDTMEVQTVCKRPNNVTIAQIGTDYANLQWNQMEGADFYVVTIHWSIRDEMVIPYGGQVIKEGDVVTWNGNHGMKKDGFQNANLQIYNVESSEVTVQDLRASYKVQTKSTEIELIGLEPATHYNFEVKTVNKQGRVSSRRSSLNDTTLPNNVKSITLVEIDVSAAELAWEAVEGVNRYIVNVTHQSSGEVTSYSTIEPSISITNLSPGSWNTVVVYAVGRKQKINFNGSSELTFQTSPERPEDIRISNVTTSSVTMDWKDSEGATYYKIIVRLTHPFSTLLRTEESRTSRHVVENLTPGTTYSFSVVSVASGGRDSSPSEEIVESTVPAKPGNLKLIDISTMTAHLQWDDVSGAVTYIVSIMGEDNNEREVRTRGTVITIENLNPGVWYDFWVKSVGNYDRINSEKSNIVRQQTVPQSPGPLTTEEVTMTTISLRWKKVHGITHFQIFVTSGEDSSDIFNVTRNFYVLSQLIPGKSYSIYIVAIGTSGKISQKSSTIEIATVPKSPSDLEVVKVSTNHINLQWTPVTGADEYTIIVRDPSNGLVIDSIVTRQSSHAVTSLKPGATYLFSIIARGADGKQSIESSQIRSQTTPLSPTGIEATQVTTNSINLKWEPVQGAKFYRVAIINHGSSGENSRIDEAQKSDHTVAGLQSGTLYTISVVTVGANGGESDIGELISEATYPSPPEGLMFNNISTSVMELKWNLVHGAVHYIVAIVGEDGTDRNIVVRDSEISVPALLPGIWYEIRVVTVGPMQRRSESSPTVRDQTEPASPSKLLVTKTDTTSISIQWEPVVGVKFYEISVVSNHQNESNHLFISVETDYTINDLIPGHDYTFVVIAIATSGRKSKPSAPLEHTTIPASLDDVVVRDATTTSITLRWEPIPGALSYTIVIRSLNDVENTMRTIDTKSTSYKVDALAPGETYSFSIKSRGFSGKLSKESPRVNGQTVPLPPTNLRVIETGTTGIQLIWKASSGAGFYRVYTEDADGKTLKSDDIKETTHLVEGLAPGTAYRFFVSAIGTSGRESVQSNSAAQTTKPLGPSGVVVENVQANAVTLSWSPTQGSRGYRIILQSSESEDDIELETAASRYLIENLKSGTEYSIKVISIGIDNQESAPSRTVTVQTIPSAPQELTVVTVTETSITMKWAKAVGAVEYLVSVTDSSSNVEVLKEAVQNQITIEELSPGTEYVFKVHSIGRNDRLNSEHSSPVIVQTVSSPVQGLKLVSTGPRSLTLAWNKSPGVVRYIVNVRNPSNELLIDSTETTELEMQITNLFPGRKYSFTVVGVAGNGRRSKESDEIIGSTGIAAPSEPTLQSMTNSSVTLSWDQLNGATEYIVTMQDINNNATKTFTSEEEFFVAIKLEAGSTYTFSLIAVGSSGERSMSGEAVTVHTIPAAPSITKSEEVTTDSVKLSWTKVKGAFRYIIFIKWRNGGRRLKTLNTTTAETSQVLSLPEAGTNYDITVSAEGVSGLSSPSPILKENSLPATPGIARVRDVTSSSFTLIWQSVKGASSYEVVITSEENKSETTQLVSQASVQFTGLAAGTWYSVQIFSHDVKGRVNGDGSQPIRVQSVPSRPTNLKITSATMNSFTANWDVVKGAMYYVVKVEGEEEDIVSFQNDWTNVRVYDSGMIFNVLTEDNFITVQGLKPGSPFQMEVRSVGDAEQMSNSATISGTTLPGTVSDIIVKRISSDSVTLEWSDVREAEFYLVSDNEEENKVNEFVQEPTILLTGLMSGTWYSISVTTFDSQNRSSNEASVPFSFQTIPAKIENLRTTDITMTGMVVMWDKAVGASSYELKCFWKENGVSSTHLRREGSLDRGGKAHKTFGTNSTNVTLNQLDPGTTYVFEVVSFSEEGRESVPSDRKSETTLPSAITEIIVNSVTETTISLSWESVKGAREYSVSITSSGDVSPFLEQKVTKPQIVVKELNPGSVYKFVVRPIGEKGREERIESKSREVKTLPLPPAEVKVDSVTANSITVFWEVPKGAVRFQVVVEYTDENRQSQKISFNTPDYILEITDLKPGIKYLVCVIAFGDQRDTSASAKSKAISQRTIVSPPSNLKVEDFGLDFVSLSWNPSEGATSYVVYAANLNSERVTPIEFTDASRTQVVAGLDSGILYSFVVRAVSGLDSILSEPSESVAQRTVPAAPRLVRVTDVLSTSISLRWMTVTGAASYTIYLSEIGYAERPITNHNGSSITIAELKPGTKYRVQIAAITSEGISSERSRRITQDTAPNAPGNPTVKFFTATSIEIEWTDMKGATTYFVTVLNEETGEFYERDVRSALSMKATDLMPGTRYSFTVRGENLKENLKSDESRKVVQSTYPEAPSVEIVSFNPFSISLSWNKVKGASRYSLFVRFAEGNDQASEIKDIKTTNYTIRDLEPGSEYELEVVAISENGLQSEKSLKILQSTSPNIPSGLELTNITRSTMTLTWVPAKGATQYRLVLANVDRKTRTITRVQGSHKHLFAGLLPGTLYSAYAYAVTLPDFATSDKSESVLQRTLPVAPLNPLVYDMEEDSVSLEWTRSRGADSYTVFINKVNEKNAIERQVKNIKSNQVTIQRLSSGSLYRFQIAAVTEFGLYSPRSARVVQQTVPASPQDIRISAVATDSFTVNWSKSKGATSYSLRIVDVDTQEVRRQNVGNVNSVRIIRLQPGTLYRLAMVARRQDADVTSRNSLSVLQRTLPVAPTGLKVYSVGSGSIGLEWERSKGASSYKVMVYELNDKLLPVNDGRTVEGIIQNYIEVTELKPATGYLFEIYTITGDGKTSDNSATIIQVTRYLAPVLPISDKPFVRLTKATSFSMVAEWDDVPNAHSYSLVIKSSGVEDRIISDISGTSITIRRLLPDTQYSVSLIAVGRSGDKTEETIPAMLRTYPGPPATPTDVTSSFTKDSVSLVWTASPGAVSYQIEMINLKNNETKIIKDIVEPRYTVLNLSPGDRYQFRVLAIGLRERSQASASVISGAQYPVPTMEESSIPLIRVDSRQWNFITVSFRFVTNAVSYTLLVRKDGEIVREIPNLKRLRHTISDLSEFTEYQISYFAVGEGGDKTRESQPLSVATRANTPDTPVGVGASDMSAETAVIMWDDSKRAIAYDVIVRDVVRRLPKIYRNVKESPFVADGLLFNTRYTVTVVAVGKHDKSEPSKAVPFKTIIPKPGSIRILITGEVSGREASLQWSPASYAISYTVTVRRNSRDVQEIKNILGNFVRIPNLQPDTTYEIGVCAVGIAGDKGEEKVKTIRTTKASIGQDDKEDPSVFQTNGGSGGNTESGDDTEIVLKEPTNLQEALSLLIDTMSKMPRNEFKKDGDGKFLFKQSSDFRLTFWKYIEAVRNFLLSDSASDLEERKSIQSAQTAEFEGSEEQMKKLLVLSQTLSTDPKSFQTSGAKNLASEIAGLLVDIYALSPQSEVFKGSGRNDFQEIMKPILQELLLGVILGEFKVTESDIQQTEIVLTPSGQLPTATVRFRIRQSGTSRFTKTITVDQTTTTIRFDGLKPGTRYEVSAITEVGNNVYSRTLSTKQSVQVKPPTPTGLKIVFVSRTYVSIRWSSVRRGMSYIVRVYSPGGETLLQKYPAQRATAKSITRLRTKTRYDVTVSSYDTRTRTESNESERLQVRTR